jgi:hypothetical protein
MNRERITMTSRRLLIAMIVLAGAAWASPSQAQVVECGKGAAAACNPTSVIFWGPPTTNADGTPLADLAGYNVLWCDSAPCTPSTPGVVIKDVGKPAVACVNGLGVSSPAPCVRVSVLGLPAVGGLRFVAVNAYDNAPIRNVSVVTATDGPFSFSQTAPDTLAPSAPSTPVVQ